MCAMPCAAVRAHYNVALMEAKVSLLWRRAALKALASIGFPSGRLSCGFSVHSNKTERMRQASELFQFSPLLRLIVVNLSSSIRSRRIEASNLFRANSTFEQIQYTPSTVYHSNSYSFSLCQTQIHIL